MPQDVLHVKSVMKIGCWLTVIYILSIDMAVAQVRQQVNVNFIQLYKENSDLSYMAPKGEIGAPDKYIINGRLTSTYMLLASPQLPVAFAVQPDFMVRVRAEQSSGVRTPSFRLGGIFYFRLNRQVADYQYATLRFQHHSNGQDDAALNPDGSVNKKTGNFSTNALLISYNFGNTIPALNDHLDMTLNHEIVFEWHKWFHYEHILKDDYGFTRLTYNFSLRGYHPLKEVWRLNAGLSYALNPMDEYALGAMKKRLNAEASFHYSFPFMDNVFLMAAAGYYGEDPYNIYYKDKYAYLRFGISTGILRGRSKNLAAPH